MRYDARVTVKLSLDVSWVQADDEEALERFLWDKLENARITPQASVRDVLDLEVVKCWPRGDDSDTGVHRP